MNPLIMGAAANAAQNIKADDIGKAASFIDKRIKYTLILIAALVIGFFLYRKVKKYLNDKKILSTNVVTGKEGLANILADRARVAMAGMGTNEEALYDIAKIIARGKTTFEAVAGAYLSKYNRDLAKDIQSELNSSEMKKFYSFMGKTINGLTGISY